MAVMPLVKYRKDYQTVDFTIKSIFCCFQLDPERTQISTTLKLCPKNPQALPLKLSLDGDSRVVKLIQIEKNSNQLSATEYVLDTVAHCLKLEIHPEDLSPEGEVELKIHTEINPTANTALSGLYFSSDVFCTQCEAEGFRRMTYFLDRPDVMTKYTTKIIADQKAYPVLLSNGNLIEKGVLPNHQHYALWEDPFKKPSYLFALVAGDLKALRDTFVTRSGRSVALEIYVADAKRVSQCQHAMNSLKHAMKWDENRFDREYDLDIFMIVAVDDFNMGAMENKGLNIFNTKYILANEKIATDDDFSHILAVVGHEYFHNWTGNRITCQDWFQLSLKEGLTVFRDQEFSSDFYSKTLKRIEEVNIIRSAQFAEDKSPMAHPIRPDSYIEMNNFYTVTVYNKGAEVIRMQQTLLGREGFKKGMDLYFARHDGQAVTCEDFLRCMEEANHVDFSLFRHWYSQDGTPEVEASGHFDADTKKYTLTFSQSSEDSVNQKDKKPFHIPISMALLDRQSGRELHAEILSLKTKTQIFSFENLDAEPLPSLFRDFSAPIKLKFQYSIEDLMFLASHDSNEFNRWDAAQTLFKSTLLRTEESSTLDVSPYLAMIQSILNSGCDEGLIAEAISLPSERILSELVEGLIDPGALHEKREAFKAEIQTKLHSAWLTLYQDRQAQRILNSSQRKLKNFALHQLARSKIGEELALRQLKSANNMTDQSAAFSAILENDNALLREEASDFFYENNRHEALTLNKFFQLHALGNHRDLLETVIQLSQHPDFNLHNPNRIYALLVNFASNSHYFHHIEGRGYALMESAIVKLNTLNPQVASRLTKTLMNYGRFEAVRAAKMKAVLTRLSQENPCADVYEVLKKALGEKA